MLSSIITAACSSESRDPFRLVPPANLTFASLNETAAPLPWPFAPAAGATFTFTATCCGYGNFTPAAVALSAAAHGLWDVPCLPSTWPILAEWGYEFMDNQRGPPPLFPVCANLTLALRGPPASRAQAVQWLSVYWACRAAAARADANAPSSSAIVSEIGHYMFSGLSVLFPRNGTGAVLPGSEIGENINSVNFHVASTRGASRVGKVPWLIDFSSWMSGWITDYTTPGFWGPASSPVGGHSPSLMRRAYYYSFSAGVGALVSEAGAVNFFASGEGAPPFPLSPLGVAGADFAAFASAGGAGAEAARGVPYVPIALVAPGEAGVGLGWWYSAQSWDTFPLSEPETRLDAWLRALWPGSFTVERDFKTPRSEAGYLVAGPWGELFDVLVADGAGLRAAAPAYRALVFVGGGEPLDADAAAAVVDFVAAGGFALVGAEDAGGGTAFPPGFLGLEFGGGTEVVTVANVTDAQTGWVGGGGGGGPAPFCAPDDAGAHWFAKTGGDPAKTRGWDGGARDRCCSTSPTDCIWFASADACGAALSAAPVLCRACPAAPQPGDVGCPSWSHTVAPVNVNLTLASLAGGGAPLLTLTLTNGSAALGASLHAWGRGAVAVLLAPDAIAGADVGGLNLTAHLLDRLCNDTGVFAVRSNVSSDGAGGGVATLANRHPWGWAATLVNNNGVVKAPSTAAQVDAAAGRRVEVALRGVPAVAVAGAWVSSGGAGRRGVPVGTAADGSAAVVVEVEAGGVAVAGFQLA